MFGTKIETTPFVSEEIDELYKDKFEIFNSNPSNLKPIALDDMSLKTTIYALIAPRITNNELSIVYGITQLSSNESSCISYFKTAIWQEERRNNSLGLYWYVNSKVFGEFLEHGYRELKDISVFLKKFNCDTIKVFINEELRSSVVFFNVNMTLSHYHLVQSLIPRILPWYFTDKPLTKTETEYLRSLIDTDIDNYWKYLEMLADEQKIIMIIFSKKIQSYQVNYIQNKIITQERQIDESRACLEDLMSKYNAELFRLNNLCLSCDGLRYQILTRDFNDNELRDYILSHKCINLKEVNDYSIAFNIQTTLDDFDPMIAQAYINNLNSELYSQNGDCVLSCFRENKARQKILRAIFTEEPILKIKIQAVYCIQNLIKIEANDRLHKFYAADGFIPNPHIYYHGCLGSYLGRINKALQEGDLINAIEMCIASAKGLNFEELSQTVVKLTNNFFKGYYGKCVKLPDGRSCTAEEAYEWLIQNENIKTEDE